MMTNGEIANVLCEIRCSKQRTQDLRAKLLHFAVEELGVDQFEARKMNLENFVDGILVGRGVQQSWRGIDAPKAQEPYGCEVPKPGEPT